MSERNLGSYTDISLSNSCVLYFIAYKTSCLLSLQKPQPWNFKLFRKQGRCRGLEPSVTFSVSWLQGTLLWNNRKSFSGGGIPQPQEKVLFLSTKHRPRMGTWFQIIMGTSLPGDTQLPRVTHYVHILQDTQLHSFNFYIKAYMVSNYLSVTK